MADPNGETLQSSRSFGWVGQFTLFFFVALLFRGLLLAEKGLPPHFGDLWGVSWDAAGCFWAVFAAGVLQKAWRFGGMLVSVLWLMLQHASYEFTKALDLPLDFGQFRYLLDPTFLVGSGLRPSHPWLLLGLVLILGWSSLRFEPLTRRLALGIASTSLVLSLGLSILQPASGSWRQEGVTSRVFERWHRAVDHGGRQRSELEVESLLSLDLAGTRIDGLSPLNRQPNVLLVILEGLSGVYLPTVAEFQGVESEIELKTIDGFLSRGLYAMQFATQQRQTHRGEYAILCGDVPKFVAGSARFSEVDLEWPHPCLPQLLANDGYRTVYLQAAPLGFMMKDQAMVKAGFAEVYGSDWFDAGEHETFWGVEDRTYFEDSLEMIDRLEGQDSPWFLTLLNVGTHHPFRVPEGFAERHNPSLSPQALTFLNLDEVFARFLKALDQRGVLQDTLVVVTSDESFGLEKGPDWVRYVSQNTGFAGLHYPGMTPRIVQDPYMQSDLAASIWDFVSPHTQKPRFLGRSLLRSYSEPRPIFFGNFYQKLTFGLFPNRHLVSCHEDRGCTARQLTRPGMLGLGGEVEDTDGLSAWVEGVRTFSTRGPRFEGSREVDLVRPGSVHVTIPSQSLFGGQAFSVPPGYAAELDLEFEVGETSGWLHIRHDIRADRESVHAFELPVLGAGDRIHLKYRVVSEGWDFAEFRASVDRLTASDMSVEVQQARLSIVPYERTAVGTDSVEVLVRDIVRAVDPPRRYVTFENLQDGDITECLSTVDGILASHKVDGCDPGLVLLGPRFYAPKGSQVRGTWTVAGDGGSLAGLIGVAEKDVGLAQAGPVILRDGMSEELSFDLEVPLSLDQIQAALAWAPSSPTGWFEVRDLQIELIDP